MGRKEFSDWPSFLETKLRHTTVANHVRETGQLWRKRADVPQGEGDLIGMLCNAHIVWDALSPEQLLDLEEIYTPDGWAEIIRRSKSSRKSNRKSNEQSKNDWFKHVKDAGEYRRGTDHGTKKRGDPPSNQTKTGKKHYAFIYKQVHFSFLLSDEQKNFLQRELPL